MSVSGVKRDESTAKPDAAPRPRSRGAGAKSPFRPSRRQARELAKRASEASSGHVEAPPAGQPDDRLEAWRTRIEFERTGVRKAPAPVAAPAPATTRSDKPERVREPMRHRFEGQVSVSVGPFGDLDEIGEFAETLSLARGVGRVRVRTFDHQNVVYDVDLEAPTMLVAEIWELSPRAPRLLHANDRIIRLKLG